MLSLVQIHNFWVLGGNFSSVSIANSLLCTDSRQFQLGVSSQSQLSPITPPPPPPLFTPYNWTLQVNDHWQYDTRIYRPSKSNINWTDSAGSWVQSEERQMFQLPIDVPLALTLCETSSARGSRRNQFKLFGVPNCPYLPLLLLCYRWPTNQKLFSMCLHSKQIKLKGINKMRGFFFYLLTESEISSLFQSPQGQMFEISHWFCGFLFQSCLQKALEFSPCLRRTFIVVTFAYSEHPSYPWTAFPWSQRTPDTCQREGLQ